MLCYKYLIFQLLFLVNFSYFGQTEEVTWNTVTPRSGYQPSGRLKAVTWVDNQQQLWLYGGETIIKVNGSVVRQYLYDLWKFNARTFQWSKITHQNSSRQPLFHNTLSSFCRGRVYVFGHQRHKKFSELWVYNMSSNFWNLIKSENTVKDEKDCFGMWCNNHSGVISLLCNHNASFMKLWIFKISTEIWASQFLNNKIKFISTSGRNISNQISVWNSGNGYIYMYKWLYGEQNINKSSALLSISPHDIIVTELNNTKMEYMSNRKGFIRWIDNHNNLHLLGGKITNLTKNISAAHWMLNTTTYTWITVQSKILKPSSRAQACFWQAGGNLWLFGGYRKYSKEEIDILNDFWIGNTTHQVVMWPSSVNNKLPGDTLKLSLVNKLIISLFVLLVVMAISIRLCYKRELNQLMSRLQKNRVVYHELSQEGDKSTRL